MTTPPLYTIAVPRKTEMGFGAAGCGLIDVEGRVVVEPIYFRIDPFHDGLAAVVTADQKIGFVDATGAMRIEPRFSGVAHFSEGLCAVRTAANDITFIDTEGREVFTIDEPQFHFADRVFSEGRCVIEQHGSDGVWRGYVDRGGQLVIPHRYASAMPFREGLAVVSGDRAKGDNGPSGYIDPSGAWVMPPRWERAWSFQSGVAAVVSDLREVDGPFLRQFKKDMAFEELRGRWGLIGKDGHYLCPPAFDYAETEVASTMSFVGDAWLGPARFSDGLSMMRQNKKWGFIGLSGDVAIKPSYERVGHFGEGLAAVRKRAKGGSRWGFIDPSGSMRIAPAFAEVVWTWGHFSEGLCPVAMPMTPAQSEAFRKVGWYSAFAFGYIDSSGDFVIEPQYSGAGVFQGGLAHVQTDEVWAYIDRNGKQVWSVELPSH